MGNNKKGYRGEEKDFVTTSDKLDRLSKTAPDKLDKADMRFNAPSGSDIIDTPILSVSSHPTLTVDEVSVDFSKVENKEKEENKDNKEVETKVETKVEPKQEPKVEVKAEVSKIETKPSKPEYSISNAKKNISGKVIFTTPLHYVVKTADGKGVRVTGKHNKHIGDNVSL